eukprot:11639357-Prorocentrum_lima.AAC.1
MRSHFVHDLLNAQLRTVDYVARHGPKVLELPLTAALFDRAGAIECVCVPGMHVSYLHAFI